MNILEFDNINYLEFQKYGNAAQFAIPFAKHICIGNGVDIGCMKKEWAFPGAFPIDLSFDDQWDAFNLPEKDYDYIFSSHCLEHLDHWVNAMDYWYDSLKKGGVLFLYLPDFSQKYWRPWNNKKHIHVFTPDIVKAYMENKGYNNIFASGIDLNNSFIIIGEK